MIYFDNAATTFPKPPQVIEAVEEGLRSFSGNPGRSGHELSMRTAEKVFQCREAVNLYFNGYGPEYVIFTMNATQALNMAIQGSRHKGGHIVSTFLEHNSVIRPLKKLEKSGVTHTLTRFPLDDDDAIVRTLEKEIRKNTYMIACTHASNVNGRVLPIDKIGKLCKAYRLKFLVDAAQSAGILPIDMKEMNIDFLCMPGHKSLYGPQGTGVLLVSENVRLDPLLLGGTGTNSAEDVQPAEFPERLESGTLNCPGICGLHAGIKFLNGKGKKRNKNIAENCKKLYDYLKNCREISLVTEYDSLFCVPVISFAYTKISSEEYAAKLNQYGICVRGGLHCAPNIHKYYHTLDSGLVRVSPGVFNHVLDYYELFNSIDKINFAYKYF